MRKSRKQVKRFLSATSVAGEKDEFAIKYYLGTRKTKLPDSYWANHNYDPIVGITYEQFTAWFESDQPDVGDVVCCEDCNVVGLVTDEAWDSLVIGVALNHKDELTFDDRSISNCKWVRASDEQALPLQKALASHNKDWDPVSLQLVERKVPSNTRIVRLMVLGKLVGYGIFKGINPDNTLEMFCVKMGNEKVRFGGTLDLGDANAFSFADANEDGRVLINEELANHGYIWNNRCRRLQKNNARVKVGEAYYWLNPYLEIKRAIEKDSQADKRRFNCSNYFHSIDTAKQARNRTYNIYKEEMIDEGIE
jgi:hypothetical protein